MYADEHFSNLGSFQRGSPERKFPSLRKRWSFYFHCCRKQHKARPKFQILKVEIHIYPQAVSGKKFDAFTANLMDELRPWRMPSSGL
jgi:hypothetical protein